VPRLVEGLSRFFGRVEILARGLENERRAAEDALARGQPLEARQHARAIVAEVPESPLALALWADAAEEAWLDPEVVAALTELAKAAPWRADVWLRLGRAGLRTEWPGAREALERAATAPDERASARLALLDLTDLDLAANDPARAARWLDRIAPSITGAVDRDVALRRAECALARGDTEGAFDFEKALGDEAPTDGRVALVRSRLAVARADGLAAVFYALRAFTLDTPGGEEQLAAVLASTHDVVVVDCVRRVVKEAGRMETPAWSAAFAFAEGRRDDARRALARGVQLGDDRAAGALLALASEARDVDALRALAARGTRALPEALAALARASDLAEEGHDTEALDVLDHAPGDWAAELRRSIYARWAPKDGVAPWPKLLAELRKVARAADRLDLTGAIEALAVERERPLRVAVVGEFNAGKSTFLNALLGEDVAPTGVLPTTATLHWVAWAPDPFARVLVRGAQDRVVPHADLKKTLAELVASGAKVERVFIYAPIERLKRVEILDTPGFNAPDPDHIAAARQAFEEAHVALWLLDATHALKDSERNVLKEIQGLGVPVQMLANKADRLSASELDVVLAHITSGLAEAGLPSYAPPIAFSARLSLKGRLGDDDALARSNWAAVEAFVSEKIVDASEALRERALRRKARRLAEDLAKAARERAEADRAALRAASDHAASLRASAARLRRERGEIAKSAAKASESARRALAGDLRPLGELPEERQRADAGLREYVRERFVTRLAEPAVAELSRAAAVQASPRAIAAVRAVLLGAVAAHEAPAGLAEQPLEPIFEAAAEAFAAALTADADQPIAEAPSGPAELRAAALAQALTDATP
jgi:GTP-binding protein EngB required for normal cell division